MGHMAGCWGWEETGESPWMSPGGVQCWQAHPVERRGIEEGGEVAIRLSELKLQEQETEARPPISLRDLLLTHFLSS